MALVNNGTVSITVTGGVGPYQYTLLSAGNNLPIPSNAHPTFSNPVNNIASNSFTFGDASDNSGDSGLVDHEYRIKCVDSNGCETISGILAVGNTPPPTATPIPATPLPSATAIPATPLPSATAIPATATPVPVATFIISSPNSALEWENIAWQLTTTNVADGTVVPFTFGGTATEGVDYIIDIGQFGGAAVAKEFTVTNNSAVFWLTALEDNLTEGNEILTMTLDSVDSIGNDTSSTGSTPSRGMIISDTSLDPIPTATPIPATATPIPATATPVPATATPIPATATPVPATPIPATATPIPATATPIPATATPIPATATPIPATATPIPATATPIPAPTATPIPAPTATPIPAPTATPVPEPTATPVPAPVSKGQYFHGGNANYPFAQNGLTSANPGTLYYHDGSNPYAEGDLSQAMTYVLDQNGGAGYPIEEFDLFENDILGLTSADELSFDAISPGEFYYIILPVAAHDLTNAGNQQLVDNGIPASAIEKANFEYNGEPLTIYKLGGGLGTAARTITFLD